MMGKSLNNDLIALSSDISSSIEGNEEARSSASFHRDVSTKLVLGENIGDRKSSNIARTLVKTARPATAA